LRHPAVADLRIDLTDTGETYSALAGLARMEELELAKKPAYDAVVHFAAVPAILITSDASTYATNVLSTYNVLEAATRLGVRKIVFASSETTYGICFAQGERRPQYVPVDEDHPTVPEDSYAMSKVAGEVTARSFHARTGADVYGLRINNVIEPHEYTALFPGAAGGDVVVVPAGVSHALLKASPDFLVIGAYADGREPNEMRDDPSLVVQGRKSSAAVPTQMQRRARA